MTDDRAPEHDMSEHYRAYSAFLTGVIANIFAAAFVLLALIAFAFGGTLSSILGWATILIGGATTLIDLLTGNRNWLFSLVALAVLGLITAVNVA